MNRKEYRDLIAFHPGYYVKDLIEEMEITQDEFAKRLGVSGKTISKLVNGHIPLSDELALGLSLMFGTSTDVWKNMQQTYDLKCIEIDKKKQMDEEIELAKLIDYKFFKDLGLVQATRNSYEKVRELCKCFQVHSLSILLKDDFLVNYRVATSNINDKHMINTKAWLQTAINIGRNTESKSFDAKKLELYIPEIRNMTLQSPEVFLPRLKKIFYDCGVTFVLLPHLKNSDINGAVKWINGKKVILAMNDRRTFADTFWFSLFHEIKHVLQQKHTLTLVNLNSKELEKTVEDLNVKLENEADLFAQNTLIPSEEYDRFISMKTYSRQDICNFAKSINIHPGIVVGRMQKDRVLEFYELNDLKDKYKIVYNAKQN